MSSRSTMCGPLDRYFRPEILSTSSLPSLLSIAYVECFLECLEKGFKGCGEDPRRFPTLFSSEASRRIHGAFRCSSNHVKSLLRAALERLEEVARASKALFAGFYLLKAELVSRMLIHTRSSTLPLAIGLAWDPYLNLPYIPGSSLKGALRSYFETTGAGNLDPEAIFGSTKEEGILEVFDTYPVACKDRLVEAETTTPHYREQEGYIDKTTASPTPLIHIAISPETVFHIPIAFKKPQPNQTNIINHIIKALESGIGARTNIGYGHIKIY